MKFFETSKYYSLKKSTYITLRWIGIIGQLISIYFVYFYLNFDFDFISSNLIIAVGTLSNLFLIIFYKKTQISDRSALIFSNNRYFSIRRINLSNRRNSKSFRNIYNYSKCFCIIELRFENQFITGNDNYLINHIFNFYSKGFACSTK